MNRIIFTGIFFLVAVFSYSQNLDLVVTASGDSIACRIDSISDNVVYYQMKSPHNQKWIHTMYNEQNFALIKYDCINPSDYIFKNGSTIIVGNAKSYQKKYPGKKHLQSAPQDELNFYLAKAKKVKKTGGVITLVGGGFILTGIGFISTNNEANGYLGLGLGFLGSCIYVVGLPVFLPGNARVNTISKIKNSNGMAIDFYPYMNYDSFVKQNHVGLTLNVRF